jgi:hypothetical protein
VLLVQLIWVQVPLLVLLTCLLVELKSIGLMSDLVLNLS